MATFIGIVLFYFAQVLPLLWSIPVERSGSEDLPFCMLDADRVVEIISNGGHELNIIGADDKFASFATQFITKEGHPHKEKNKDFWLEDDLANDTRMKKRKLDSDEEEEFQNVPFCKMERTYEKRFDKFPYVRPSVTCVKNPFVRLSINFECKKVYEERPILRISASCSSFSSSQDETWEHSTETLVTGCQAVLRLPKPSSRRT